MRITEHPILRFDRGKELSFTFNGQPMKGYEGETIAAALHAAGVKARSCTAPGASSAPSATVPPAR